MSRFFASGYSESESESSSEESVELKTLGGVPTTRHRFSKDVDVSTSESSEDEAVHRVVRSARDKRYLELKRTMGNVRTAQEKGEWSLVASEFDGFCKQVQKSANLFEKEGVPKFLIKFMALLEMAVKEGLENKEDTKKMSVLNMMKQKIRKFNKPYATELEHYRQHPEAYEHEDELLSEGKVDFIEEPTPSVRTATAMPSTTRARKTLREPEAESSSETQESEESGEEEESSSDWSTEEELEVSDESEAEEEGGIERWLKKDTVAADKTDLLKKKERKLRKTQEQRNRLETDYEEKHLVTAGLKEVRLFDITPENVDKRLKEIQELRGKRGFDRYEMTMTLRRLLDMVRGNSLKTVRILVTLIPIQYEYNVAAVSYLNTELWKHVESDLHLLLDILLANPSFVLNKEDELGSSIMTTTALPEGVGPDGVTFAPISVESIMNFAERLDDEFTKSLQNIDPHTTEYVDRLRDEIALYRLLIRFRHFCDTMGHKVGVWRITLRIIEHLYYKHDDIIRKIHSMIEKDDVGEPFLKEQPSALLEQLCLQLYSANDDRIRTRAMLCHIYHHALHDRYFMARDLLLLSHLQETIQNADMSSQILFNRTMVQVGMCAFRLGMIRECQTSLQDIHFSGRVRELLAQGFMLSKYGDKNPDMERMERQRQVPFHMHINIELLECIFLVASMLIEVPNIASNPHDSKTKVISRAYRRMLDYSERQIFVGPPENTRDYVMAASKALLAADWRKCRDLILGLKIWSLVPNIEKVHEMLTLEMQEQGLRTFLLSYQSYYDSLGIQQLHDMFELPSSTIYTLTSRMILNDELHAVLDPSSDLIIFSHIEPSRLQHLALQLAEKNLALMETNEKFLEVRSSSNLTDPSQTQRSRSSATSGKTRQPFTRNAPFHKQHQRPLASPHTNRYPMSQQYPPSQAAPPVYR